MESLSNYDTKFRKHKNWEILLNKYKRNDLWKENLKIQSKDKCKLRKLQTNITDEYRCKNPQQNTSKQNPTTH